MKTLTLKDHSGNIIALLEFDNNQIRIQFTRSELLKKAIESFIKYGIDLPRYDSNNKVVRIRSVSTDADFFEKLAKYFEMSFDYKVFIA
jgi:hypothetical protein